MIQNLSFSIVFLSSFLIFSPYLYRVVNSRIWKRIRKNTQKFGSKNNIFGLNSYILLLIVFI